MFEFKPEETVKASTAPGALQNLGSQAALRMLENNLDLRESSVR
jgi:hypothetical protein